MSQSGDRVLVEQDFTTVEQEAGRLSSSPMEQSSPPPAGEAEAEPAEEGYTVKVNLLSPTTTSSTEAEVAVPDGPTPEANQAEGEGEVTPTLLTSPTEVTEALALCSFWLTQRHHKRRRT